MFDKLGLTAEEINWLELDPVTWETSSKLCSKSDYRYGPAEGGDGQSKEYISSFRSETSCQAKVLAVSKNRAVIQKNSRNKSLAKIGLK